MSEIYSGISTGDIASSLQSFVSKTTSTAPVATAVPVAHGIEFTVSGLKGYIDGIVADALAQAEKRKAQAVCDNEVRVSYGPVLKTHLDGGYVSAAAKQNDMQALRDALARSATALAEKAVKAAESSAGDAAELARGASCAAHSAFRIAQGTNP